MKVKVVVVGKVRGQGMAAAIAEYEARAARYWPLEVTEVREESGREEAPLIRKHEGHRLLERAGDATILACDEGGDALHSTQFAELLQRLRETARDVAFVIGGAYGFDAEVRAAASRTLSLAPWTLPHELARLVLAEQLYRAGTIVRREPYHK